MLELMVAEQSGNFNESIRPLHS